MWSGLQSSALFVSGAASGFSVQGNSLHIRAQMCQTVCSKSCQSFILERAAFSIGWGEGGALSELVIIPSQITIKIKNKLHFR